VNDRADIAALANADGLHVGQTDLGVRDARRVLGPGRMIGVSTHSLEQARRAVLDGADYLGVGPMFPSGTKSFAEFPGLDFAREVGHEIRLPTLAIGGIDATNVGEVLAAGVGRVAVSSAIVAAPNPAAAAAEMLAIMRRAALPLT
jgi:thiamine-phosphate pyrophosphorylase